MCRHGLGTMAAGWVGDRIDVKGGSEVDAAAIFLPVAITCRLRAIATTGFRRPWLATRPRRSGQGRMRSLCRGRLAYDVGVMHHSERVVSRTIYFKPDTPV